MAIQKNGWSTPSTTMNLGYNLPNCPTLAAFSNGALGSMAPGRMTKYALGSGSRPDQVHALFGRAPYGPVCHGATEFNFGQCGPFGVLADFRRTSTRPSGGCCSARSIRIHRFVQEVRRTRCAPVVWPRHRLGSIPPVALGRFCVVCRGIVSAESSRTEGRGLIDFWERRRVRILEKTISAFRRTMRPLWLGLRIIFRAPGKRIRA